MELKEEIFYLFRGDRLMYQQQLHVCISAGFTPKQTFSDLRISTILKYVASGSGVSLLVENTANSVSAVTPLPFEGVTVLGLEENPGMTMLAVSDLAYQTDTHKKLLSFFE
jgi:DNA-binding transcriptional LysR family regulator